MESPQKNLLDRQFSRRSFLFGALASSALLHPSSSFPGNTTGTIDLVSRKIPIQDLPSAFDGYRIGFITDPHVGVNVPFEWLEEGLRLVTSQKIDLLLLGGDYIAVNDSAMSQALQRDRNKELHGRNLEEVPSIVYDGVAKLASQAAPKDGVYGVLGNHDCWVSPEICSAAFARHGIPLLINEAQEIKRGDATLMIYGTDDYWNGIPSINRLASVAPSKNEVRVLLTHNPDYTSKILAKNACRFHLSLSGHTHGGQIKLPGVGALFYNVQDLRFGEGLVTTPEGSQCYTSRGIGLVEIPYRINCPSEATVLELVRG